MTKFHMTPEEATKAVQDAFPFAGYFGENLAPWLTIGQTVQRYL